MLVHGTLYRQFSSGLRQIHQHLRPPRPLPWVVYNSSTVRVMVERAESGHVGPRGGLLWLTG